MTALCHPILEGAGVRHGFGTRSSAEPPRCVRPRQVHGIDVAVDREGEPEPATADAIVGLRAGSPVGVVTADCIPVLVAAADGSAVAAIHAGWRGLAAGVIEAGLRALAEHSGAPLRAVVGPHAGPCCYEVDAPVVDPLRHRFGDCVEAALARLPGQQDGRWQVDLGFLALVELERCGVAERDRARLADACTICEGDFHSYRRDGERAGRQLHWIQAGPS